MTKPAKTLKLRKMDDGGTVVNPFDRRPLELGVDYTVEDSTYWRRRIRDKSVELLDDEGTPVAEESETDTETETDETESE